jgi:hypothetical protein
MSAGGISYDCLSTSRKVTLPSVESWGTNMNIIKDPTKGVYTRRIDKVGDTQDILLAQEDSGDRIAEYINVYARGVNPMVSVSYDNYGKNGGTFAKQNVKLPYKPEVFYPPVLTQENLTPLSRLPRNWTYALTNPEMPGIIQEMKCPSGKSAIQTINPQFATITNPQYQKELPHDANEHAQPQVHDSIMHCDVNAPHSQSTQGSHMDVMESNNAKVNQNKLIYEAFTNKKSNVKKYLLPSTEVSKQIHENMLKTMHNTNKSQSFRGHALQENGSSKRSTHDNILHVQAQSSKSNKNIDKSNQWMETNPSNAIDHDILKTKETNMSNKKGQQLKYFPQFIEKDTLQNVKENIPVIDAKTSMGSNDKTFQNVYNQKRHEGEKKHLYNHVDSTKSTKGMEKNIMHDYEDKKHIVENPLAHEIRSNHSSILQKTILDPSQIQTKESVCISVDTPIYKNIYKQSTDNDVSTIAMKTVLQSPHETARTYIDQDKWIGTRPEHRQRILHSSTVEATQNNLDHQEDFYNIQSSQRNDIESRNAYKGTFDPRPQNIARLQEAMDMSDSSTIDYRYTDLKKSVQNQFHDRYST